MSEREINKLDPDDIGLKAIMGDRFHDETTGTQQPQRPRGNGKSTITAHQVAKEAVRKSKEKAGDAQWEPAKPEPDHIDKLKACTKALLLFGSLSWLIFYWESAGLMAESIAVPSMCVCTALAGLGVGKSMTGGNR